jgi:serine/threonine-protein kinase HipA
LKPLLKFSLAGIQLKFSISTDDRGPTVPLSGQSGNTILKMPDGRAGYEGVPEAEYAAMTLAMLSGLDVAPVSLIDARTIAGLERWSSKLPGASLLVTRFDRVGRSRRVHVEELAQVLDIPTAQHAAKYRRANFETIANVVSNVVGVEAVGEVIDRIVLNVLIGNGDAHLKNWAIRYPDGRTSTLSPAYDIVPTVLYLPDDDLGLNLNGSKKFSAITPASFERLGAVSNYGHEAARKRAESAVSKILAHWDNLRDLLPHAQFVALDDRLAKLNLVRNSSA